MQLPACNILPRDTAGFTGRAREIKALVETVEERAESNTIVPLYAIDGMPGIGKSAFAIHAGHLLQEHFPDGQFYVDLHAYTVGQEPVDPADALFRLLSASGVRADDIPHALEDRATMWRNRLARSRTLVILDNALSRLQVRHLLPGAGRCLVIVTSRVRLGGLIAHQAPINLTLETLPPAEARALFATLANRDISADQTAVVDDLMRVCGHLPLAICLVAARLRPQSRWRISDLLRELVESRRLLRRIGVEGETVEAAFDLSYRRLPAALRRFFRRLGLHPGCDVDRYAAAALGGTDPDTATGFLEALYDNHLLEQPMLGRFRLHDLTKRYAAMRAETDRLDDRNRALDRLLRYYRRATEAACRYVAPDDTEPPAEPADGLQPVRNRRQAMDWLRAEQANLLACAGVPATRLTSGVLPALAMAMAPHVRLAGPWDKGITFYTLAARAAEAAGDQRAHADCLQELGFLRRCVSEYGAADQNLRQAIEIYELIGHRPGVAEALTLLAGVSWRTGNHKDALDGLRQALEIFRSLGIRRGQANALNEMGTTLWATGSLVEALDVFREALAIHEERGDLPGLASTLQQIGGLSQQVEGYPPAIAAQERALRIHRELGDRYGEAKSLNYLGVAHCYAGDYAASRSLLRQALVVHRSLGYRAGEAHALNYLGLTNCRTGEFAAAEDLLTQALAIYRELRHRHGEADVLNQLGVLERRTARLSSSAARHGQALILFQHLADPLGQAEVLNNLGELGLATGRVAEALEHYQRALDYARQAQNPLAEANALHGAGRCAALLDNPRKATRLHQQAMDIYQRIGVQPHPAG